MCSSQMGPFSCCLFKSGHPIPSLAAGRACLALAALGIFPSLL